MTMDAWCAPTQERKTEPVGGAARQPTEPEPSAPSKHWAAEVRRQSTPRGSFEGVHESTREVALQPAAKEVLDLVAACNHAARCDKEDVVWFGYNCSDNKTSKRKAERRAFGMQEVALTRPAV